MVDLVSLADADETLVGTRDVARLLRVHTNTVHNLVKAGKLECLRIGNAKRYVLGDVKAYIQELRGAAVQAA